MARKTTDTKPAQKNVGGPYRMPRKTWLDDPSLLDAAGRKLERDMRPRQTEMKSYLRLYYSRLVLEQEINLDQPYRETTVYDEMRKSVGNLTREVVDAALALVCTPLKPEVVPIGADFDLQQGCKQAQLLIAGIYDNCNFLRVATKIARDAATAGIGAAKAFVDPRLKEIKFERISPLELFWPEDDAEVPRTLMHIPAIPRDNLLAMYPDHADAILRLPSFRRRSIVGVDPFSRPTDTDTVRITEAWATQLSPKIPGRHTVVAGDIVLIDEPWPHDIHPVIWMRWLDDYSGFQGVSLGRIVGPYDTNNRRLVRRVYDGLAGAVPWVKTTGDEEAVDMPSDVPFAHIHCEKGSDVEISMPAQVVSPEVLQEMERNRQRAFNESGVNQQAAQGAAPASLTSGKAQETWIDLVNTRLKPAQAEWQTLWEQGGRVSVLLAQHARGQNVMVAGANHYETMTWPDIDKDKYKVRFKLSSGLGLTVAARFQNLQRLFDAGAIDMPEFLRGLDLPDTEATANEVNAPRDLVHKMISQALHEAKFVMPSAMQGADGLSALVRIGSQELQQALLRGVTPKKNLEMLRRLILAAKARLKNPTGAPAESSAPVQVGAPAPGAGGPPAPPDLAPPPPGAVPPPPLVPPPGTPAGQPPA